MFFFSTYSLGFELWDVNVWVFSYESHTLLSSISSKFSNYLHSSVHVSAHRSSFTIRLLVNLTYLLLIHVLILLVLILKSLSAAINSMICSIRSFLSKVDVRKVLIHLKIILKLSVLGRYGIGMSDVILDFKKTYNIELGLILLIVLCFLLHFEIN